MNLMADIQQAISQAIAKHWPDITVPEIEVTTPPPPAGEPKFGDYSCAVALAIAKQLKAKPLEIAEQLKSALGKIDLIANITVTAPGFINFHLDFPALAHQVLQLDTGHLTLDTGRNIVIEHTSINPNKAAHVGHLRNACLGDSLARLLKFAGHNVEVQNYIDDLGLQVADSVVAYETFGEAPTEYAMDEWMWKIYADIQKKYEGQPKLQERRDAILKEMEEGKNPTAIHIVEFMVQAHLHTLARFDIQHDLLVYEHDIVQNHLWDNLFEELKFQKLITQPQSGKNQGAWLVEFGKGGDEDKILVRSNGIPTYTAKDIAYQLWKFGKSELPNYQRKFTPIDQVINVIDERQGYPQAVIKHVLAKLGYKQEADNSLHLGYGVVKLSEKAMRFLGQQTGDKTSYSMSGRAGVGVMVNDLLNTAIAKQIETYQTDAQIAEQIAAGSIRYYMLRTRPVREIIFDFDEALKTDGNTGAYLQYAYARAASILAKLKIVTPTNGGAPLNPHEQALIKTLSEFEASITNALSALDPSLICDYAYQLASAFAKFYETSPVVGAETPEQQTLRINLVSTYQKTLKQILELLGIPAVERI